MYAIAGTLNLSALRHRGSFVAILAAAWAGLWLAGAVFTWSRRNLTIIPLQP